MNPPARRPILSPLFLLLSVVCAAPAQQTAPPSQPGVPANMETSPQPVPSVPVVSFSFERAGLTVPRYTIRITTSLGSYQGTVVSEPPRNSAAVPIEEPFDRSFNISPATADKIVALAHSLDNFNTVCASKARNIADTGKKTLSYLGPDGQGSCTYNYSENKIVVQLTDIFRGIAETLDEGRRLDHLHRYDRLGLDAAVGFLTQELADGRALEVGAIAPTLRSIAGDNEVMERVRVRANALLAQIPPDTLPR